MTSPSTPLPLHLDTEAVVRLNGHDVLLPIQYGTAVRNLPDGEPWDHDPLWNQDPSITPAQAWADVRVAWAREVGEEGLAQQELVLVWCFAGDDWQTVAAVPA